MKTIILAAGRGPRMLPLTKDTPKYMLKICEKSILEKQLENLQKANLKKEEVIVVTGYLSEKMESFCGKLGCIQSLFNPFYEVSGIALTLWIAKEELKEGFLFLYGDVLFEPRIIQELLKRKEDICLAIKRDNVREEAEKVIERNGIIKSISKEGMNGENAEFIGIAKFSVTGAKKLIEELNYFAKINLNTSFITVINNLIEKGEEISIYDIKDAQFIDIDFPEDLERAKELFH